MSKDQIAFIGASPLKCIWDAARIQFDLMWAGSELLASTFSVAALKAFVRQGDGEHPILTLPGFSGPEFSLAPLNFFLKQNGFAAEPWGLGMNVGPQGEDFYDNLSRILYRRLDEMAQDYGRPVSLIGQSLGGIYAREVARDHPELVERVITLGSPAYLNMRSAQKLNRTIGRAFTAMTGSEPHDHVEESDRNHAAPPSVPLVSIYSRYDGVVSGCSTRIPDEDLISTDGTPRENIEVLSSHCGMAVNPLSLLAITDRLTEDVDDWTPFNPGAYLPGSVRPAIPYWYPHQAEGTA